METVSCNCFQGGAADAQHLSKPTTTSYKFHHSVHYELSVSSSNPRSHLLSRRIYLGEHRRAWAALTIPKDKKIGMCAPEWPGSRP